ncbi:MAG: hypothetical protein EAZ70_10730 [Runella slithyformis]|nr:MAG: hypothetical protein EAY79_11310 [Runella slithyformis]TAE95225.1 MAG: hypothetical protein EAZ80_09480 [Runella slithyformis]TAF25133.1 MAG: hypothetical protein EAZ70_10730 [Runella slithyformis]TAF49838.1 MAG: hypothetical protein EAZ63_00210 [Runella slithyformis]TAF81353.1 MAG: hypothetical protein EAZ50_06565 [Runella slithyformis]
MNLLIFKPDLKFQYMDLILLNAVFISVLAYNNISLIFSFAIFLGINGFLILAKNRFFVEKITIDKNKMSIVIDSRKFFKRVNTIIFKKNDENRVYSEIITKAAARGGKLYFLKIVCNDKVVCQIEAGLNGWSLEALKDINNNINSIFMMQ